MRQHAEEIVRKFDVVAPNVLLPARALSGGNGERLLVGRELTRSSRLVVAAHSTKGLDVASTMYVRELLAGAREEGRAVMLVSADLEEILQLSDRIAVMYGGKVLSCGETRGHDARGDRNAHGRVLFQRDFGLLALRPSKIGTSSPWPKYGSQTWLVTESRGPYFTLSGTCSAIPTIDGRGSCTAATFLQPKLYKCYRMLA